MSSAPEARRPRAAILGCAGQRIARTERSFFAEADPLGFILFERNCESPDQVRGLVGELRAAVGRDDAPVLIDQEGGRVARLKPPHWRAFPPAAAFGAIAQHDRAAAAEAAWTAARLIAAELFDVGVTVDCAPVLDVPVPGADEVIGDRAFAGSAKQVADLGQAFCEGLLAGGVAPVIKHLPGHGRATADSHARLPFVNASKDELEEVDFAPFKELRHMPCGMTAHVAYAAFDPERPATVSPAVIAEAIRGAIGFDGLLITDDLSMKALSGPLAGRARDALAAGCDVVLHGTARRAEMESVVEGAGPLSGAAATRLERAMARRRPPGEADLDALARGLESMLERAGVA